MFRPRASGLLEGKTGWSSGPVLRCDVSCTKISQKEVLRHVTAVSFHTSYVNRQTSTRASSTGTIVHPCPPDHRQSSTHGNFSVQLDSFIFHPHDNSHVRSGNHHNSEKVTALQTPQLTNFPRITVVLHNFNFVQYLRSSSSPYSLVPSGTAICVFILLFLPFLMLSLFFCFRSVSFLYVPFLSFPFLSFISHSLLLSFCFIHLSFFLLNLLRSLPILCFHRLNSLVTFPWASVSIFFTFNTSILRRRRHLARIRECVHNQSASRQINRSMDGSINLTDMRTNHFNMFLTSDLFDTQYLQIQVAEWGGTSVVRGRTVPRVAILRHCCTHGLKDIPSKKTYCAILGIFHISKSTWNRVHWQQQKYCLSCTGCSYMNSNRNFRSLSKRNGSRLFMLVPEWSEQNRTCFSRGCCWKPQVEPGPELAWHSQKTTRDNFSALVEAHVHLSGLHSSFMNSSQHIISALGPLCAAATYTSKRVKIWKHVRVVSGRISLTHGCFEKSYSKIPTYWVA